MKYSEWHNEVFRREFPIVLQMVRDRCVYAWTVQDFIDVWNEVGTFPVSNGYVNKKLHELAKFGVVELEVVGRRNEFR